MDYTNTLCIPFGYKRRSLARSCVFHVHGNTDNTPHYTHAHYMMLVISRSMAWNVLTLAIRSYTILLSYSICSLGCPAYRCKYNNDQRGVAVNWAHLGAIGASNT